MADGDTFRYAAFISCPTRDQPTFGAGDANGFKQRLEDRLAQTLKSKVALYAYRGKQGAGQDEIAEALRQSAALVVLAGPSINESAGVAREVEMFLSTGRPILVVGRRYELDHLPALLESRPFFDLGYRDFLSVTANAAADDKIIGDLIPYLVEAVGGSRPVAEATVVATSAAETNASTFYASPTAWDSDWLRSLTPNRILFWVKNGRPHLSRLHLGHTVVLLAGQPGPRGQGAIVAVGVLAAGADREFRDEQDRRRWPVLITHVFDREVLRRERVEAEAGSLLKGTGGGVHAISQSQIGPLSRLLGEAGGPREIPLSEGAASEAFASGETVDEALREHPHIREITDVVPPPDDPAFDGASDYLSDAPAQEEDLLDRGGLAVALARRLHLIWCRRNRVSSLAEAERDPKPGRRGADGDDTFIVHVDAPWGGGKTTFANFVAQALNPSGVRPRSSHFLYGQLGPGLDAAALKTATFDGVFLGDYSATRWEPHPRKGRRPWIIVRSNAWRYQDVAPPWWQIYLDVASAIRGAALEDAGSCRRVWTSNRAESADCVRAVVGMAGSLLRWTRVAALGLWYRLTNTRLLKQLTLTLGTLALLALLLQLAPLGVRGEKFFIGQFSIDDVKKFADLVLLGLGLLGGGFAALGTAFSQSLAPDIDFSGETKSVGVGDPIARFRWTFARMLDLGRRPILLIVDDLDRCAPKTVVELLRGFQTILQSPRMFVMILGDRNWIETAHSVAHAEMKGLSVGSETNLGARFVEKVFQLSFVLPAMSAESRDRYTRAQLGGAPAAEVGPGPDLPDTDLARKVEAELTSTAPVTEREANIQEAIGAARAQGQATAAVQAAAAARLTAQTAGDIELTRRVENLLAGLAPLLPNNPRQIKRVINAFPLFATVGAQYFGYAAPGPLATEDGTSRWRQLALWVALSTEWPVTWRRLAAEPRLLDAAYAPTAAERDATLKTLVAGKPKDVAAAVKGEVERLQDDPALAKLLGSRKLPETVSRASALFAQTRVEPAAVRQFNRIIWEPGFDLGEEDEPTPPAVPDAGREAP